MPNVPLSTRFVGFSQAADLQERKSANINALSQPVTMQDLVNTTTGGSSPAGITYSGYPQAGLTTAGAKFTYTDGVELISYHIKGIYPISVNPGIDFNVYLCTVIFPEVGMGIEVYPGSITGMFQSGTGPNFILSPLAVGGLVEMDGDHVPLTSFKILLNSYNNNPQPDGSYWYSLTAVGDTGLEPGNLTGLMSYDFELLLPNYLQAPTVFQD